MRRGRPAEYLRLLDGIERTLIVMPLPRLQRIGGKIHPFIYSVAWTVADVEPQGGRLRKIIKKYQAERDYERPAPLHLDNRICLKPGVLATMARFQRVIRDLVEAAWIRQIEKLNPGVRIGPDLHAMLFGSHRVALERVRRGLIELQNGRCFYCDRGLAGAAADHFLPWTAFHIDRLENLVATHSKCHSSKSDFLAASDHIARWRERMRPGSAMPAALAEFGEDIGWPADPRATISTALHLYRHEPEVPGFWVAHGKAFETNALQRIEKLLFESLTWYELGTSEPLKG